MNKRCKKENYKYNDLKKLFFTSLLLSLLKL
jgi:hypothetical protein